MMKSTSFLTYLQEEVFLTIPGIKFLPMFGGYGMYLDGVIVGLVVDDVLYLKVDSTNQPDFQSLGSKPFTYSKNGKPYAMSYWEIPEFILENPDLAKFWLYKSKQASLNKKKFQILKTS